MERKYRFTLLVPIRGPYTAPNVRDALVTAFSKLPASIRRTLTQDQGNEMFEHEAIEEATGLAITFADPHPPAASPHQQRSNENGNGLIRQYFPKGTDFDHVTDERIRQVAIELNERPRLCLDDRSPMQCMNPWKEYLITV